MRRSWPVRREPAQVYAWTAVSLLLLMVFAGIVADAGRLFLQRVELQRTADAAARTGAMEVDIDALRAAPESCPRLNPSAAEAAAARHLRGVAGRVEADESAVGVELNARVSTTLLGLFGAGPSEVRARAIARPRAGVGGAREECGR